MEDQEEPVENGTEPLTDLHPKAHLFSYMSQLIPQINSLHGLSQIVMMLCYLFVTKSILPDTGFGAKGSVLLITDLKISASR